MFEALGGRESIEVRVTDADVSRLLAAAPKKTLIDKTGTMQVVWEKVTERIFLF